MLLEYMASSFYFYDLETSGINAHQARIMQFGGVRTDMNLKPIGEPDNIMIKMADDMLPDPEAILVTGITPQATIQDGITEAEFLKYFYKSIVLPDTIFVGFNSIRFDDEFMRCLHYRNFYDPYEWQWKNGCSRWDLLDVVRMTRALRPDGIEWPFAPDGKPSNRLELITASNALEHTSAHDALSDVYATIAVARLIRNKQQKLFDYLLDMRNKKKVAELVKGGQPFVYSSGKYPNVYEKTTVVQYICEHPGRQGALVYDLRQDPEKFINLTATEIAKAWQERVEDETKRFPLKTLQYNRCPAIAPLGVLVSTPSAADGVKIDMKIIETNRQKLSKMKSLQKQLCEAIDVLDGQRQLKFLPAEDVHEKIYDGFAPEGDRSKMSVVRAADAADLLNLNIKFADDRFNEMLPLYKARNYPASLSDNDRQVWEAYRFKKLMEGGEKSLVSQYFSRLAALGAKPDASEQQKYLLEELLLWGQSIIPEIG